MDIGRLFRVARITLGYSVNQLAMMSGVSSVAITSYESDTTVPDIPNAIKIANALEIPIEELGITTEKISFNKDTITYSKKYTKGQEIYYYGICKCGNELYISESDVFNRMRTKCKKCTAQKISDESIYNLSNIDIERLDTLFQNSVVKRSVKLGVRCTLTLHDYIKLVTSDCYYCGEKPNQEKIINGKLFRHNGIDRLDSKKGYERDNVVPCCKTCNMAKGSLTEEEFKALINKIYEYQKERD